jgi:hypothetical protein
MLFASCSRSYSIQAFSFPPGSKPHESNWTYICKVIDWQQIGKNHVEKGKRNIEIIISDKNKKNVLEDSFEIESASIRTNIKWLQLKHLTLELYEVGNKYADDEYNKNLLNKGPRHLITLNYVWDGEKYVKSITEPVISADG